MPYAQVRGVNLYYEDRGQGQPLLLIPGALGTGLTDFSPQLEQLPLQGIRVIVPDARGYGKSRPPVRQFPLDFYEQDAQDCAALMDVIGCQSYAVSGWSDGAIIAMLVTLRRPPAAWARSRTRWVQHLVRTKICGELARSARMSMNINAALSQGTSQCAGSGQRSLLLFLRASARCRLKSKV